MLERSTRRHQVQLSLALMGLGAALAWGAWGIPSEAGYSGVGPNFLPWLVALALLLCGFLLLRQALVAGFRIWVPPSGAATGQWIRFAWVSAGLLANALLITRVGFILSCTLCFALAVRGLRGAAQRTGWSGWLHDALTGAAIAAPVYWMFTKLLAINLPGLTGTGWI
jgi:putative tricarboxylic transport membrane protein